MNVGDFKTILNFLAYLACLTVLCVALGYALDKACSRFKWWRLR